MARDTAPALEGVARGERMLEACFEIGRALREARGIEDAARTIATAIARAAGAKSVALRMDDRVLARVGPASSAELVAVPLRGPGGTVGIVELPRAPDAALTRLLEHVGAEIEAFRTSRATNDALAAREAQWRRAEKERAELLTRETTARSVAERERARMYQLFTQAPALVAIQRGPEHVLEFVNAGVQRVVGQRDVVGAPLRTVVPNPEYIAVVDRVLTTGERSTGTEVSVMLDWDQSGQPSERHFNFVHEPMRDFAGRVEGVMSFGFDVTDLVTARQRVEAAVRELEATSRAKDEFLATVSHELRTPLSSILGWAALLGDRCNDPATVAKGAEVIHRSARAQARIIDDILDVSRIITGKLRIDSRPVSLESVVRDALEVVRPSAAAKEIALDVSLPDEACTLVGDEERLRQVAWNLLSNAIKFTERGGHVEVRLWREATELTLEVSDTGRGISPEFLPFVFERFRQADSSTTRTQGGLGLGLAIVRHLVELHGGHVEVRSQGPGMGATFAAVLPIRAVASSRELEPETAARAPRAASPRLEGTSAHDALEGLRVLVVDDEADAREMLATAVTAWGIEVTTADSAATAMSTVAAQPLDVVISDIGMPGEDGYSLVKRMRALFEERHAPLVAIALTAYARREDAARALASGFDFHVAKPIELDDLHVILERAVRCRKATA